MKLSNIQFLWVLWIIPILIVFYIYSFKRKMELINKFVSSELKQRLLENVSFNRQKIKMGLIILAISMIVLALVGPRWGFHWEEVKQRGVDTVLALDVSKSMLAEDVSPNRLQRAKREIIDLLNIVEGDRIALVAFAGTSFLQAPLTLDYGAVRIFLDDLDTDLIPVPGTALGEAIKKSLASFDPHDKNSSSRVVILITDGEDHMGDPIKVAEEAKNLGVKIYTIGIGKEGGAPIPDSENGGFKKDSRGEMVLTHLDEETLQKVALKTGGSYVRSVTGEMDLEKIYQNIKKEVQDKDLKSGKRKRYEERFQWPLGFAIFLLLFEVFFSERKRKEKLKKSSSLFAKFFLFFAFVIPSLAQAAWWRSEIQNADHFYQEGVYDQAMKGYTDAQINSPLDDKLKYNLANTHYKMEQYDQAEKLFQSLAEKSSMPLKQKAFYNLGNSYYKQGKLKEAVEAFKMAQNLDPQDEDAKHNLKFVQDEIKRRLEEMKKQQQNQQQNQQNQEQNQQNKSCDNPQQSKGGDEGEKQEGKKEQNQEKKADEQKGVTDQNSQEKDDKSEKNEKSEKSEKSENGGEEEKKEKKEEKEGNRLARPSASGKEDDKNKMDQQEAERWFSSLDENRKKFLQQQMQGNRRYRTEKDW